MLITCSQEATDTDFYKDTVMMIFLSAAGGYEQLSVCLLPVARRLLIQILTKTQL